MGSAVDSSGNVYITDAGSATVLKVSSAGVVTNLAGTPGVFGNANGTGGIAQFTLPYGSAVDASGNVYVSDYGSGTIRKITAAGAVTTLAGTPGVVGSTDGTGAAAQFYNPAGVAVDSAGNVYVADSFNDVVRKITSAGVSSTLAGTAGAFGSANGTGAAAQFNFPDAVAVDSGGNVYVADGFNNTIRKITSAGVVTTLAGTAGVTGSADGTGAAASFNLPEGIAVDSGGNVYVAENVNNTVRKITAAGVVTTLAGIPGVAGSMDGTGSKAEFNSPTGISVDSSFNVYVADTLNGTVRKAGLAIAAPVITAQPQAVSVTVGSPFSLSVTATGGGTLSYQWFLGASAVSGATSSTYSVAAAATANGGSYTVTRRQRRRLGHELGRSRDRHGDSRAGHHRPAPGGDHDRGLALLAVRHRDRHGHALLPVVPRRHGDIRGDGPDLCCRGGRRRQCGFVHRDGLQHRRDDDQRGGGRDRQRGGGSPGSRLLRRRRRSQPLVLRRPAPGGGGPPAPAPAEAGGLGRPDRRPRQPCAHSSGRSSPRAGFRGPSSSWGWPRGSSS